MELDLVEVVRRASVEGLSHVDLDLYIYYCAERDEETGVSRPRNIDIHRDRGISEAEVSRAKGRLSAKRWIEHLGGRRVRPLVGFEKENCAERKISGDESVATPTNPGPENCAQRKNSAKRNISEVPDEVESCAERKISDSGNCAESNLCAERYFPPDPHKDKYNSASNSLPASMRAGGHLELSEDEFLRRYGRDPDELCDQAFVERMKNHPEFKDVDAGVVWVDMGVKAKKPKTCYRFWKWLLQEKRKAQTKGAEHETGGTTHTGGASGGGGGGTTGYDPFEDQETG